MPLTNGSSLNGSPLDRTDPPRSVAGADLFIPISLGHHYYSSDILLRPLPDSVANSRRSVSILCDRRRLLSNQIRGESDIQQAEANIRLQQKELTRSLMHLGLGSYPSAMVANWSFLLADPRYGDLL